MKDVFPYNKDNFKKEIHLPTIGSFRGCHVRGLGGGRSVSSSSCFV